MQIPSARRPPCRYSNRSCASLETLNANTTGTVPALLYFRGIEYVATASGRGIENIGLGRCRISWRTGLGPPCGKDGDEAVRKIVSPPSADSRPGGAGRLCRRAIGLHRAKGHLRIFARAGRPLCQGAVCREGICAIRRVFALAGLSAGPLDGGRNGQWGAGSRGRRRSAGKFSTSSSLSFFRCSTAIRFLHRSGRPPGLQPAATLRIGSIWLEDMRPSV